MPRAIAHSELGASAGLSFASACMVHDKCADVFVRAFVAQITGLLAGAALLSNVGGVAAVTISGSFGPRALACVTSTLQLFLHSWVYAWKWMTAAVFL